MALEIKAYLNQSDLNKVDKQYSQFIKELTEKYKITVKVDTTGIRQMQTQTQSAVKNMKQQITNFQTSMDISLQKLQQKYARVWNNPEVQSSINKFKQNLNSITLGNFNKGDMTNQFKQLGVNISSVANAFDAAQPKAHSFFSDIGTAAEKFPIWIAVSTAYMLAIHKLGEAFEFTVEQSKLFTNLQMEMTNTKLNFTEITKTANDYALSMKSNTDNVMKAISVFGTYNSTMDETLEKSKAAIIMNNITGGSIEQTADDLMGIMAQYDLAAQDAMHVVDIISGTARNLQMDFPKGISTISEGIRTVGSVAQESKVPIELLSSMIGTLAEKTRRDGSEIANSLRTIFGRVLNVGEDADPEAFKNVEKGLDDIKIKIREIGDDQSLRPVGDILSDLASKWDTLTDAKKQELAFDMAGMYRKNIFMTMMESYNDILKNHESAINSVGVAESKQAIYEEGLTASINELKSSWEKLYLSALSPDKLRPWIELATNAVNLANSFGITNIGLIALSSTLVKFMPDIIKLSRGILPALLTMLNPVTLGIAAITAGIIALNIANQEYIENLEEQYDEDKKILDIMNMKKKAMEEDATKTNAMLSVIQDLKEKQKMSNEEHSKYIDLMSDIQRIYPTVFNNLDIEKAKYEDIVLAINKAIQAKAQLYAADSHGRLEELRSKKNELVSQRDEIDKTYYIDDKGTGATGIYNAISKTLNSKKLKALNEEISKYDELISTGVQTMIKGLEGFKPYNPKEDLSLPKPSGGNDSSGNKSGSKTEIKDVEIDKFYKLQEAVNKTNDALEVNKKYLSNTTNDEAKIKLLESQNDLYKQQQDNLHALNEARRKEIQENVDKLKAKGFDVSYDPNNNQLLVKNEEHLNELYGKNNKETNEIRKTYKDLIDSSKELNSKNQDGSKIWIDDDAILKGNLNTITEINTQQEKARRDALQYKSDMLKQKLDFTADSNVDAKSGLLKDYVSSIQNLNNDIESTISKALQDRIGAIKDGLDTKVFDDKIKSNLQEYLTNIKDIGNAYSQSLDVIQEKFDKSLDLSNMEERFNSFDEAIAGLEFKLSTLSETDFNEKMNLIGQEMGNATDKASQIREEFERLSSITPTNREQAEQLKDSLQNLKSELRETNSNIISYAKALEQVRLDKITSQVDKATDAFDRQMNGLQHNLDMLEGGMLDGTELSFDFSLPEGNELDLASLVQSENDLVIDIETDSYKTREELQAEFNAGLLTEYENYYKTVNSNIDQQNLHEEEIRNQKFADEVEAIRNHGTDMGTALEEAFSVYSGVYETQWDKILTTLESKVSKAKSLLDSLVSASDSVNDTSSEETTTTSATSSTKTTYVSADNDKYNRKSSPPMTYGSIRSNNITVQVEEASIDVEDPLKLDLKHYNVSDSFISKYGNPNPASGKDYTRNRNIVNGMKSSNDIKGLAEYNYDLMLQANQDKINKLKSAIELLEKDLKNKDLSADTIQEYQDAIIKYTSMVQDSENKQKQIIKSKYDYIDKLRQEDRKKFSENEDDIQEQLKILNTAGGNSDLKVDYTKDLLDNNAEYLTSLKAAQNELISQRDELTEGSYEWNVINEQVKEYSELLEDATYNAVELANQILDLNLEKFNSQVEELNYKLELSNIFNSEDTAYLSGIYNDIAEVQQREVDYLNETLEQLRVKLSLLQANSTEWNVISAQISNVTDKLKAANLELANNLKSSFSDYLSGFKVNSGGSSSGGSSSSESQDEYLEGLEKQVEVERLLNYIKKNNLTLTAEQSKLINSQGKIKREEFDMLKKELELQEAELKLQNLKQQKTIQTMQKMADGSWDFVYTVDQEAIDRAQQDVWDKQIDLINAKKDLLNKQKENSSGGGGSSSVESQAEKLEQVLKNAENRVYKSMEDFRNALESLGMDLPVDEMVDKYWKYFLDSGELFLQTALESTKTTLAKQLENFKKAGDTVGQNYVQGLLDSIDAINKGDGDILEKETAIIDLLASQYAQFALAGNEQGMAFIKGLIDSMETPDVKLGTDTIAQSIISQLNSNIALYEQSGQTASASLLKGLLVGIDTILKDTNIADKTKAILDLFDKTNEYGTLGQSLGMEFMNGMISVFENMGDEVVGDGKGVLSEAINSITAQLDAKIAEFASKGDMQGVAYAEALKEKLMEALKNAQLTQEDIIKLLSEYKDFDLAGLLSGTAYEDALTDSFDNASDAVDDSNSAIVEGLEDDVKNFEGAGKAQGDAYKNAITSAFETAINTAKNLIKGLTDYINSQKYNISISTSGSGSNPNIAQAENGGMTPPWSSSNNGKLMFVHPEELILNKFDTSNFLKGLNLVDNLISKVKMPDYSKLSATKTETKQNIFQISKLELPNITNQSGLENLIDGLTSAALQHSYSK